VPVGLWREKMKNLMLLLMLVMLAPSRFLSDEIPPGVTYIKASDEINAKALEKLEQVFSQTTIVMDDLLGAPVTCGPFLWARIKDMGPLANLKVLKADIMIPLPDGSYQKLEGAVLRTEEEKSAFCRTMEEYLGPGDRYKIRRPNAEELRIYWAMIPFDIEEPIFVAESDDHNLLMHFLKDSARVFWISDLQGIRMKENGK